MQNARTFIAVKKMIEQKLCSMWEAFQNYKKRLKETLFDSEIKYSTVLQS